MSMMPSTSLRSPRRFRRSISSRPMMIAAYDASHGMSATDTSGSNPLTWT
jgi:hypothetical protein